MNAAPVSALLVSLPARSQSLPQRWCAPRAGRLRATGGTLWVTEKGQPDDHHLAPGQALAVRAGAVLWLSPWSDAAAAATGWHFEAEGAVAPVAPVAWALSLGRLLGQHLGQHLGRQRARHVGLICSAFPVRPQPARPGPGPSLPGSAAPARGSRARSSPARGHSE